MKTKLAIATTLTFSLIVMSVLPGTSRQVEAMSILSVDAELEHAKTDLETAKRQLEVTVSKLESTRARLAQSRADLRSSIRSFETSINKPRTVRVKAARARAYHKQKFLRTRAAHVSLRSQARSDREIKKKAALEVADLLRIKTAPIPPALPPSKCHPAYSPCIPHQLGDDMNCSDLDDIRSAITVKDRKTDPYKLDRDGDGRACESNA